ncbi:MULTISPECIES: Flp family type IVb pilin [Altererythrobacter]|jgi:pilus assembly protein Flp/PilA|uniref:Pilus assembly protein Flp/PilA n=1 Tax=Altererythrobacter ishigakiensis TaxID=476157 RepID=A0A562UW94_9SPHN|nr:MULTISPECIES: Flp family type IVb pilin [Altererythrobacter]MBO6609251.1 Flp family type IVb pilin [Altererythrobacter sp.]MBO6641223.1 Flp family type IVb pilin [Altererythrobacter sp.]MBO6708079.1 Flp family type IVb pilin [Altererythrobacter sp.]MBO6945787.1 Flp family type IVb pilin [Altererythrobacter sp.]MDX1703986.1 Flp family type IVb pilin [Altererythrobacter ishigakiensis]
MKLPIFLKRIGSDNSGATAVEYGLIVSLIVIASMGAFGSVADENARMWNTVESAMAEVGSR